MTAPREQDIVMIYQHGGIDAVADAISTVFDIFSKHIHEIEYDLKLIHKQLQVGRSDNSIPLLYSEPKQDSILRVINSNQQGSPNDRNISLLDSDSKQDRALRIISGRTKLLI